MGLSAGKLAGGDVYVPQGRDHLKLAVAHRGLTEISGPLLRRAPEVTAVDATGNSIADLHWLSEFPRLQELVLDGNRVRHVTKFPRLDSLRLLSLNNNNIGELGRHGEGCKGGTAAVEKIARAFPNLTFLSMLRNPGCPSYFTGSTAAECKAFRLFALSRMPRLKFFDGTVVTEAELEQAARDFGDPIAAGALNSSSPCVFAVADAPAPRAPSADGQQCHSCGAALLLHQAPPGSRWPCPKCGAEVAAVPRSASSRRLSASGRSASGPGLGSPSPPPLPPLPADDSPQQDAAPPARTSSANQRAAMRSLQSVGKG